MKDSPPPPLPTDLICPAEDIFDRDAIAAAIARLEQQHGDDHAELRRALVPLLKAERARGRAAIAAAFAEQPFAARPVTRAYSWQTDCIILTVLDVATRVLHPRTTPTDAERIAVCAVGGYGRGEMAPNRTWTCCSSRPTRSPHGRRA